MAERTFEVKGDDVNRVAFGGDPRVVVEAGKPFKTDDMALADRAAAHPALVETTSATAKKQIAKEADEAAAAEADEEPEA